MGVETDVNRKQQRALRTGSGPQSRPGPHPSRCVTVRWDAVEQRPWGVCVWGGGSGKY